MTEEKLTELASRYGINTKNYHHRRKARAKILCDGLGDHAIYANQSAMGGTKLATFSSYEEAVEDLKSVSILKSVVFMIYEVTKTDDRWGVSYKMISNTKA